MNITKKERKPSVLTPALQQEMIDNFPLVLKLAHQYKNYGLSFDDVRSAGTVGLTKALIALDGRECGKTKGSFLWAYVKGYILNEIRTNKKHGFTIGKALYIKGLEDDNSDFVEQKFAKKSKDWDDGKNIFQASVKTVFNRIHKGVSFDSPLKGKGGDDSDVTYGEVISVSSEDDILNRKNCRKSAMLRSIIQRYVVNPYEQRVLAGMLEGKTFNEISKDWFKDNPKKTEEEQRRGVNPQTIHGIYNRAVEHLRKIPHEEFMVED